MTRSVLHQARLVDARESGEVAGREWQCLRDDLTWDQETWIELLEDISQNPWAPGHYVEQVTDTEAHHLRTTWDQHFRYGAHAQQAETARANTVNRSVA